MVSWCHGALHLQAATTDPGARGTDHVLKLERLERLKQDRGGGQNMAVGRSEHC